MWRASDAISNIAATATTTPCLKNRPLFYVCNNFGKMEKFS